MATPNTTYNFPTPPQAVPMPAAGGTTRSGHFSVPAGMKTVTIFTPNLATSTSLVLETLTPAADNTYASPAWVALEVFNLTDGSLVALDGLTESKAITLPCSALGGGILSFTCADSQASSPLTIWLIWSRDG